MIILFENNSQLGRGRTLKLNNGKRVVRSIVLDYNPLMKAGSGVKLRQIVTKGYGDQLRTYHCIQHVIYLQNESGKPQKFPMDPLRSICVNRNKCSHTLRLVANIVLQYDTQSWSSLQNVLRQDITILVLYDILFQYTDRHSMRSKPTPLKYKIDTTVSQIVLQDR